MRVIDTRIVMGDNEVFECAYEELKDVVDLFVVLECCTPFGSGKDRKPTFKTSNKFNVLHIPFYLDYYEVETVKERERDMRIAVGNELLGIVKPTDIFTALDGDEIINRSSLLRAVEILKESPQRRAIECHMPTSNFFGNWIVPGHTHKWPKVVYGWVLETMNYHDIRWWPFDDPLQNIPMAGWHFSHCGRTYIDKCVEHGEYAAIVEERLRYFIKRKETTFDSKPAKVMPKEFLPKSMQTPEMLEIFYRP